MTQQLTNRNKMKTDFKKYKLLIGIIFFIVCVSYFIFQIKKSNNIKHELYSTYSPLLKADKVDNYVINKYDKKDDGLRHSPGITFITLNNNSKIRVWAEPNEENNLGINEFLQIGDLILKKSNNDSIFIVQQSDTRRIKHLFILINE
jgi:hypothetical protein